MNEYLTLQKQVHTDYVVRKSRFIGHAAPVSSTENALAYLEGIRKEHRSASHNCFAYIIGSNKGIIRYSDDGEPSGTAGKPIVDVLASKDVTDCIVVVTRYFGGILLGAGGLVRAYSHTASIALDAAGVCAMHETEKWLLTIAYPLWDRVNHALQSMPAIVESIEYLDIVKLIMFCRVLDADIIYAELMRITDGKIQIRKDPTFFYHPWEQ